MNRLFTNLAICAGTAFLLAACATVVHDSRLDEKSAKSTMSAASAAQKVKMMLRRSVSFYGAPTVIESETFTREGFTLSVVDPSDGREAKTCTLKFGTNTPLRIWDHGGGYMVQLFYDACGGIHWRNYQDAQTFSDALVRLDTLAQAGDIDTTEHSFEDFKKIAAEYRAKSPKPVLSEEAHKYQVLAENAFDEKRYGDAIEYYTKGIEIAPWWASGHYNRAMLYAKQDNFEDAIDDMKRYLELEPNAADSRTARDKMYIWEGKVEKSAEDAPAKKKMERKSKL